MGELPADITINEGMVDGEEDEGENDLAIGNDDEEEGKKDDLDIDDI